jgi:putative ABC transport system permease protein
VSLTDELTRTLVGVAILVGLTTTVLWLYRVPRRWAPALAILRGAIQLALLSIVLTGIISSPLWVGVALIVMFGVAVATATSRVGWSVTNAAIMGAAMAAGILIAMSVVFASGAIEFSPRYVLAIGGIIIGNAMSIATLAGRRFVESTGDRWDEVEGWMALGATPRQSTIGIARSSVYSALIPITDQTKTTGLVALPGAFVGAIFGGASPLEAGRFQIVVLSSVIAAGAITAVIVVNFFAPVRRKPVALA